MSHVLWLELERFYVGLHRPGKEALIVVRDKLVLDASRSAMRKGVRPGMEVSQAKALTNCSIRKWSQEEYVARQNAWLDVCCDYTGTIEPIDQHVAALDLTGHPDPLDVTERLVRALATRTKLEVRYGAGNAKWIAKLASERGDVCLASSDPELFLAPLSVSELLPVQMESRQRLAFLGYGTIGQVARIPLEVLQRQFGEEGLLIFAASRGRHLEPVETSYPLNSLRECLLFEGAVDNLETIDDGLKALASRIGQRLTEQAKQGSKLSVEIETEGGKREHRSRTFAKRIDGPTSALTALRLLVRNLPIAPIVALRTSILELEPVRHRQSVLHGTQMGSRRPDPRFALRYVKKVFGDTSVQLASEIELPRRVRVLREWQNATGWR